MIPEHYRYFVMRLFAQRNIGVEGQLHSAIGIAGEGAELLDMMKKVWVYNKPFDRENAIEEVGDALFYLVAFCEVSGFTLEQAMRANIAKLKKRYPNGYTDHHAQVRLDKQP